MRKLLTASFIVFFSGVALAQEHQEYFPDPDTSIQRRLEEWKDLKFGLLMHWGAYSQWGIVESWSICPEDLPWASAARKKGVAEGNYAEYVKAYENLKTTFNPAKFNPERWAAAAAYAGMKYMVFTTKHHDGFCMFDTRYTDYKITDPGCPFSVSPHSNVTREIFSAFRKQQMWIGAYFSKPDWHSDYYWWRQFPASDRNCNYQIDRYPAQWKKFVDYTHGQINELVSDYGQVDILWLDGGWVRKTTDEEVKNYLTEKYDGVRWARNPQNQDIDMPRLVQEVRAKQPKLIVVDRAVPGQQQNYLTPEQHIPENGLPYPWETCMTMANSWSYVPNDVYKPAGELIRKLVDIVSKGGNYLLNIGPSPEGEFDDTAYQRLHEIGDWMKINGQAIYGTRMYKVFGEGEDIRFTQSRDGSTRFVFLFRYPDQPITLEKMQLAPGERVTLLSNGKKLNAKQVAGRLQISLPPAYQASGQHVWVLRIGA